MPVPLGHRGKNRADEGRLTEKRQDTRYRDAFRATGEIHQRANEPDG